MKAKKATQKLEKAAKLVASVLIEYDTAPKSAQALIRSAQEAVEKAKMQVEDLRRDSKNDEILVPSQKNSKSLKKAAARAEQAASDLASVSAPPRSNGKPGRKKK